MVHSLKRLPGFPLLLLLKDGFVNATTSIIANVNLPILTILTQSLITEYIWNEG